MVAGVVRLLKAGEEVLRVSASGIRYPRWSNQTIAWSEIRDVTTWRRKRTRLIVLHLNNPEQYPRRGARALKLNRALIGGDIGLSLDQTDRTFFEAVSAIRRFRYPLTDPAVAAALDCLPKVG
jgi:hypothetical protein